MKKIEIEIVETQTFIVPDKIWMETWRQVGHSGRAGKHLKKIGFEKKYGKKINANVVLKNAWTWALYNPEEAREMLDNEREKAGISAFDDKEFDLMLIKRAMSVFNTRLRIFSHWIEMYNYQEYAYVYERRFPRIARKHRDQLEKANSQAVSA